MRNQITHRVNQLRRILVIRMQHDDNVATQGQRFVVTSLLVPAITQIVVMLDDVFNAERMCHRNRFVGAIVINKNNFVHNVKRYLVVGLQQSFRCVVSRKDYYNFL